MPEPSSETVERVLVRRILVALDASRESLTALEAAAQVASRMRGELTGLFVEDADLLKLAGHPNAREVSLLTCSGRALDLATVEREFRSQAAVARRTLERVAQQWRVPWSFQVTRGAVQSVLAAAALEADMVAMGRTARPFISGPRLGQMAHPMTLPRSLSLLMACSALPQRGAMALAYDGSPGAADALELAARLADDDGGLLVVFLIAESGDIAAEHEAAVRRRLRGSPLTLRFHRMPGTSCSGLLPLVRAERPRLLVVGLDPESAQGKSFAAIVERFDCPVVLMRR